MNIMENEAQKTSDIFLDKLTPEQEEIKSNINSISSDFNLEYQKLKIPPNSHSKFNEEFKKLVDFVKESNFYRDIYGNKITKKGKLIPTPFQKIRKINEEIKIYFENRIHKKDSELIIKNFRSKANQLIPINKKNSNNKSKNLNLNKNKEIYYKTMGKLTMKSNKNKEFMPLINNKNKSKTQNFQNFLYLTNTPNSSRIKYFNDSEFNQINFWKAKIIKFNSLNKTNYLGHGVSKSTKIKNIITDYNNNKNNKKLNNSIHKTINIKKCSRNNNMIESKSIDDTNKNEYKYKLFQFNLHQLIKPNPKFKGKIMLNARKFPIENINNYQNEKNNDKIKKKENKIIAVNMDKSGTNFLKKLEI